MRQVCHIHRAAGGVKVLLHHFDHLVAALIHLDIGEHDSLLCKLAHLVLNLVTIWRALRMVITIVADVLSVARSVSNVEGRLYTV